MCQSSRRDVRTMGGRAQGQDDDDMVVVRLQRLRLMEEPFSLHNKEPFSPFISSPEEVSGGILWSPMKATHGSTQVLSKSTSIMPILMHTHVAAAEVHIMDEHVSFSMVR